MGLSNSNLACKKSGTKERDSRARSAFWNLQILLVVSSKSVAQVRQLFAAPPLHVRHELSHLAQLELPES